MRRSTPSSISRFTIAASLAVATSFLSGCDRFQDSQTGSDVEIRLDVPDDPAGATVTLSGLPPAVASAPCETRRSSEMTGHRYCG